MFLTEIDYFLLQVPANEQLPFAGKCRAGQAAHRRVTPCGVTHATGRHACAVDVGLEDSTIGNTHYLKYYSSQN